MSVFKQFMTRSCPATCGWCGGPGPDPNPTSGPNPNPGPTKCGMPAIAHGRVIAGTDAVPHSWPWQILLTKNGRAGCGGTIVAPTWVVTAAHCIHGQTRNPGAFSIKAGKQYMNRREQSEQEVRVQQIIEHPQVNLRRGMDYDIALLKLSRPLQFNREISPACLPSGPAPMGSGSNCYLTGWGKTSSRGQMHSTLQQAKMPVVSQSTCEALNYRSLRIHVTSRMLCTGDAGRTRVNGCQGDSGGPFVWQVGGRWELHGAVSHGSQYCNSNESYTVFANVNFFKDWIQRYVR